MHVFTFPPNKAPPTLHPLSPFPIPNSLPTYFVEHLVLQREEGARGLPILHEQPTLLRHRQGAGDEGLGEGLLGTDLVLDLVVHAEGGGGGGRRRDESVGVDGRCLTCQRNNAEDVVGREGNEKRRRAHRLKRVGTE